MLAGAALLAWLRSVALDAELARAEPKTLRYWLLDAAARIVRRARQVVLPFPRKAQGRRAGPRPYRRVRLLGT